MNYTISKTKEGIEYRAFVENPKTIPEIFSLCDGDNIEDWLEEKYSSSSNFGVDHLLKEGCYRKGGWLFDLRPYLKKYIIKEPYGFLHMAYAPSVYLLRRVDNLNSLVKIALAPKNF